MHQLPIDPRNVFNTDFPELEIPPSSLNDYLDIPGVSQELIAQAQFAFSPCTDKLEEVREHAEAARSALALIKRLNVDRTLSTIETGAIRDLGNSLDSIQIKHDHWLLKHIENVERPESEALELGVALLCEATRKKYPNIFDQEQAQTTARKVNEHLIMADRANHPTHGFDRNEGYVTAIRAGHINPFGEITTVFQDRQFIRFDGGSNYGQWAMFKAVNQAIRFMDDNDLNAAGFAISNMYHAGRIGDWAAMAARQGFIANAVLTVGGAGRVAPFGRSGIAMGTNPIAKAIPFVPSPIVADTTTAAEVEGMVRLAAKFNLKLPPGLIQTWDGKPSRDPEELYHADPELRGSIVNLGGHRGFSLSAAAIIENAVLNARPVARKLVAGENEVSMQLIRLEAVVDKALVDQHIRELNNLLNSAYPQDAPTVFLPGLHGYEAARPYRERGTVPIAQVTWDRLCDLRANPDRNLFAV